MRKKNSAYDARGANLNFFFPSPNNERDKKKNIYSYSYVVFNKISKLLLLPSVIPVMYIVKECTGYVQTVHRAMPAVYTAVSV